MFVAERDIGDKSPRIPRINPVDQTNVGLVEKLIFLRVEVVEV